ncbi:Degradation arginine-rich protein for mis-folding [Novymonas esmeraldas]|uniref:Degradation arginine-rich protein for mis-folding n=1 Tax=Novymonas esmeraldas TaxID=1808958 RepID=A0AAW0F045_9TRYP
MLQRRATRLGLCALVVAAVALVVVAEASLLTEVPPEQSFLLLRRHMSSSGEDALRAITRGLPSSSIPNASLDHLQSLSSKELSKMLRDRDSDCHGCVERRDLVQRAYEVQQLPTMDERVAWQLTVSDRGLMTGPARLDNVAFVTGALTNADCRYFNKTIYCNPRHI